jgi:hypothetical protein
MRLKDVTLAAAARVSTSMASTTFCRVFAENTGASLVLAAVSRFTAMIKPISLGSELPASTRLSLTS